MKCPVCFEATLVMSDRQGIEIDYCPQCRGVWLDRGELDKIIERTAHLEAPTSSQPIAPSSLPPLGSQPQDSGGARTGVFGGVLGELSKEISRSHDRDDDDDHRRSRRDYHHDDDDYKRRKRKKKSGILSDLFDFD